MGFKLRIASLALAISLGAIAGPEPTSPAPSSAAPTSAAPTPDSLALTAIPGEPGDAGVPAPAPIIAPDQGITIAGANIEAIRTPSAPEAWGGVQSASSLELSQRVASYDLHAVLDPKLHTVEGTETLHWKNRSAVPVKTIYFHLYLNGFEGPRSTWMNEKGAGNFRVQIETHKGEWGYIDVHEITMGGAPAKLSFIHPDGGPESDRSVMRAELPAAVAPGEVAEIHVSFHDQLPRVVARTGYWDSYHLVAQWFPKIGVLELPGERGATAPRWNVHEFHFNTEFYADFGSYNLEITAPKGFTVAATGERAGEPVETPAGVVHKFHQDDIHDAVFCAWDKFATPLKDVYQGAGSPAVTVETYFPSEFARSGAVSQQATLDSLKYFSDTLGAYPYRHLTVIVPPYNASESGGMEYETFFTSEGGNGLAGSFTRFTSVHEFGHGYFMGLLATNEFEEPYLDEGMNELWNNRMLDGEAMPINLGLLNKLGFKLPDLGYWDMERVGRGPNHFAPDPVVASSWQRYSNSSYGSIYPRTALLFHDLEAQLPPGTFAHGMKLYYQRWHHRHPSTADLRAALEDGCEKPEEKALVDRWFENEIYGITPVDDAVMSVESSRIEPEPGTELVDGKRIEIDSEEAQKQIAEAEKAFEAAEADGGTANASEKKSAAKGDAKGGKDAKGAKDAKGGKKDAAAEEETARKKFKPGPFPYRSVVKAQRRGMQIEQTLLVKFEDGSSQTLSWPPGESWHRWVFDGPARVESAQLDPEGKIFLDIDKLDDGKTREGTGAAGKRWSLEVTHWMELFYATVGGL